MQVLVTRPAAQAQTWVTRLRARGIAAHALPLIDIAPPSHPEDVQRAWRELERYALAVFVSPNAAEMFFAFKPERLHWPAALRAAVVGPGTTAVLHAHGVAPDHIDAPHEAAAQFDSEALWEVLRHRAWLDRRVLIVRGDGGRDWLAQRLQAAGAAVDFVSAYRRELPRFGPAEQALLQKALTQPGSCLWLFSSSEAVANLARLPDSHGANWSDSRALATHPRIAAAAQHIGFGRVHHSAPTLDAVVRSIQSLAW